MDLKALFSTFALIFIAELGDKTQLTTMVLAAQSKFPASIFIGAALALVASSLLGVVFGAGITQVLPLRYIKLGAGIFFVIIGIFLVLGRA